MSRIGRRPIKIPQSVKIQVDETQILVTGPKGKQQASLHEKLQLEQKDDEIKILADYKEDTIARTQMGTLYSLLNNMITGVSTGFQKQLRLVGVGYRAAISGKTLELNLGYSHPIKYELPDIVDAKVNANTQIVLESCDKQALGQVAALIKQMRPPEPYKGKGVLFEGEQILRKAGKSGKK
jgi:large subunit ribosomal protein L6